MTRNCFYEYNLHKNPLIIIPNKKNYLFVDFLVKLARFEKLWWQFCQLSSAIQQKPLGLFQLWFIKFKIKQNLVRNGLGFPKISITFQKRYLKVFFFFFCNEEILFAMLIKLLKIRKLRALNVQTCFYINKNKESLSRNFQFKN